MKINKTKVIKALICIICVSITCVMLFFFSDAVISLSADIALKSVKT